MKAAPVVPAVYPYDGKESQLLRTFDIIFAPVPARLQGVVEAIISNRSAPIPCSRVPEGVAHVVFMVTRWEDADRERVGDATLLLSGAHTVRRPMPLGVGETIVAQLRPGGARAIFGVPADVLANRMVAADAIWGAAGTQAIERIAGAPSATSRLAEFSSILTERLREVGFADTSTVAMAAWMMTRARSPREGDLSAKSGFSQRHLRRMFDECLGVSPKSYARTLRLRAALQNARPDTDLAQLATAIGYYDQAHMTHEFRNALGLTPARLLCDPRASSMAEFGIIIEAPQSADPSPQNAPGTAVLIQ